MLLETYLPLFLFAIVSTFSPGGATTLATASGAHFGYRRSLPVMAGIALGLASMAAAAALGLAGVFLAFPALQMVIKVAGSIYLLCLAWRLARSGSPRGQAGLARPTGLAAGVWMLWHNPKGWAMTAGAAASFAALAEGPAQRALVLASTFGAAALLSLSTWCLAGQMLAKVLTRDRHWHALNIVLALLLVASIFPMWRV